MSDLHGNKGLLDGSHTLAMQTGNKLHALISAAACTQLVFKARESPIGTVISLGEEFRALALGLEKVAWDVMLPCAHV